MIANNTEEQKVKDFNLSHKVGDIIIYKNAKGESTIAETRWDAEILSDTGAAVVFVKGNPDAVKLNDLEL